MNGLFKGLVSAVLALSCVSSVAAMQPPGQNPPTPSISYREALKNNWVKVTLAGSIVGVGEAVYIALDKTGVLN